VLITPAGNDLAIGLDLEEVPDELGQLFCFRHCIVRVADDRVNRFRLVPLLHILTGTMNHSLNLQSLLAPGHKVSMKGPVHGCPYPMSGSQKTHSQRFVDGSEG